MSEEDRRRFAAVGGYDQFRRLAKGGIESTPFVLAEIVPPEATGATVRYTQGFNCSGTNQNEVIQVVRHPDGTTHHYVIMRGLSGDKATAIRLILNAPED